MGTEKIIPETLWHTFHRVWTRDVHREGYAKKDWLDLEHWISELLRGGDHENPFPDYSEPLDSETNVLRTDDPKYKWIRLVYPDDTVNATYADYTHDGALKLPALLGNKHWEEITTARDKEVQRRVFRVVALVEDTKKEHALHYSKHKPDMSLIPHWPLWALATVYMYGAEKYERDDWRRGHYASEWFSSTLHHLGEWWERQDRDAESGLPHLWMAFWGISTLIWQERYRPQWDNRPANEATDDDGGKYREVAELLREIEDKWSEMRARKDENEKNNG